MSNAPKDATHYLPVKDGERDKPQYWKQVGDDSWFWEAHSHIWQWIGRICLPASAIPIKRDESVGWTGEGLPHVDNSGLFAEAERLLRYEKESGRLFWKDNRQSRFVGREAGFVNHHGYRRIHIFGTRIDAHRIVWLMHMGCLPNCEIDHINGNKLDNRLENLRLADQQRNQQNVGVRKDNSLGVKGVRLRPSGHYQARVKLTDGTRMTKSFTTIEDAVTWLAGQRSESHQEFANTPEQIAAEERHSICHEAQFSLPNRMVTNREIIEHTYDLMIANGYRKQEAAE